MKWALGITAIGLSAAMGAVCQASPYVPINQPGNVIPSALLVASGSSSYNAGQGGTNIDFLQDGQISASSQNNDGTNYIFDTTPYEVTATLAAPTTLSSIGAYFPDDAVTPSETDRNVTSVSFAYEVLGGNTYIPIAATTPFASSESSIVSEEKVTGTFPLVTSIEYTFTPASNEPRVAELFADAVPEPASAGVLLVGVLSSLSRRPHRRPTA